VCNRRAMGVQWAPPYSPHTTQTRRGRDYMMSMRKNIVRSIALGLVGVTLAFAHPTDVSVSRPTELPEMRQEKIAFVQYRVARAAAERDAVQPPTLADDEEMRQEKLSNKAFRIVDRRTDFTD